MKRKLLAALLTLPLISCVRVKEVKVPVPVKPDPCLIAPPPNANDIPILGLTKEEGCPDGVVCLSPETTVAIGLYMRDAGRVFGSAYACPYVKIDDTIYTALKRYIDTGTILPTED